MESRVIRLLSLSQRQPEDELFLSWQVGLAEEFL